MTITDIIDQARDITGSVKDKSVIERYTPDAAIIPELTFEIIDLNRMYGSGNALKEVTITVTEQTWQIPLTSQVGNDVLEIKEVVRSDAYVDRALESINDPLTGGTTAGFVRQGQQSVVADWIAAERRNRANEDQTFEVLGDNLRIFPPAEAGTNVLVRYISNASSIDTLPESLQSILVYRACVAIFDGMLNRALSQMQQVLGVDSASSSALSQRMQVMKLQRQQYQDRYDQMKGLAQKTV